MMACVQCRGPQPDHRAGLDRCEECVRTYPSRFLGSYCVACGEVGTLADPLARSARHVRCKGVHLAFDPRAEMKLDLDWEDDVDARSWVDLHPHGGTHEEIAELFGVSRETIRKIQTRAFAKLAQTCPELARHLEREEMSAEAILDEWAAARRAA